MLEDAKRTGAYYNAVMQNRAQFAGKVCFVPPDMLTCCCYAGAAPSVVMRCAALEILMH